jgi:hypothetical protein
METQEILSEVTKKIPKISRKLSGCVPLNMVIERENSFVTDKTELQ